MSRTIPVVALCGLLALASARAPVSVRQSANAGTTLAQPPFRDFLGFNRRPFTPPVFLRRCGDASVRTYSGYCNNQLNPLWGSARTTFLLKSTHIVHSPQTLPNPRAVSNLVCREPAPKANRRGMSELVTFFGQFLDHTVTETENSKTGMPIPIPADDPVFTAAGGVIPFFRTVVQGYGVNAAPVNSLSSYIDAASVYGTSEKDAKKLRTLSGGKMKLDASGHLTKNDHGFFVSGDKRVNENPLLTSLHTLWTREHNVVADEVAAAFPDLGDEATYQLARAVVAAELQAVTWHEFLPAVLGRKLRAYSGYRSYVNAGVSAEFSTVAFRVGHTLINGAVTAIPASGPPRRRKLRNMFFNPKAFVQDGLDAYFRGMTRTPAAEVDAGVTEEVRDFLVDEGRDSMVQLDLAALNVQRGRDHAVPSYNTLRSMYRLPPAWSFADITSDKRVAAALAKLYGSVSRVEAWVGGISEDHKSGSLGALFGRIWEDEFTRLRDGDRFYFEKKGLFTPAQVAGIPTLKALVGDRSAIGKTMRKVILRNSGLKPSEVKPNPFFV